MKRFKLLQPAGTCYNLSTRDMMKYKKQYNANNGWENEAAAFNEGV